MTNILIENHLSSVKLIVTINAVANLKSRPLKTLFIIFVILAFVKIVTGKENSENGSLNNFS